MSTVNLYFRNLPHFQKSQRVHFVTFCTRKREHLSSGARDVIFKSCLYEHERRAWIEAFVVMPDHVHILLSTLKNADAVEYLLSEILQAIKGASAHVINKKLGRKGALWQEESFDHVIRDADSLRAKIAYVVNNPVRKRLVKGASEYKWVWTADPEFMEKFLVK